MASPNPDNPLRDDVSDEYRYNRELYDKNAKKFSGQDETEAAGNSSKKFKTDTEEISKRNKEPSSSPPSSAATITPIEEDVLINDNETPNTSNENHSDERVSIASKVNRKRKHDET